MDKLLKDHMKDVINQTPIIDPHSHLKEGNICGDLLDVATYHWIMSELNSVGMNCEEVLDKSKSKEERLLILVPWLKKIYNTSSVCCLKQVLKDLYGFCDDLDENNCLDLLKISEGKSGSDGWSEFVVSKTGIKKFVTSLGNSDDHLRRDDFLLMADLHYLFNPYMALDLDPWFPEFHKDSGRYLEALEKIGKREIFDSKGVCESIEYFLSSVYTGRVKYFNCVIFADFFFGLPDYTVVDGIISKMKKGEKTCKKDIDVLIQYTTWNILKVLNDLKATLQICTGAEYQICGGRSLSRYNQEWVSSMIKTCHEFPDIRFDFMSASRIMYHELAVAAKMIRNVSIQAMWWHTYTHSCMKELYTWLEIVPLPKLGGFFCDAYFCEMTYGKLQLFKNAFAEVLTEKVEDGVFSLRYAEEVVRKLLYDNPANTYNL